MEKILELQAQLKNLYSEETKHRLSERSVVSIILKLQDLGELSLVYTLDGKEYLTPEQLETEIRRELHHHGGRMNVIDLQPWLNVDIKAIEEKVQWIVSRYSMIHLVHGELISNDYLEGTAREIAAMLAELGSISVADIVNRYNLPTHFVNEFVLARYIPSIIDGQREDNHIYTTAFVDKYRRRIRGVFSALSRPTMVSSVRSSFEDQKSLFDGVLEKLAADGDLPGSLQGKGSHAVYVPFLFERARMKWIDDFRLQNNYLDYSMMIKLDISNPKAFAKERFGSEGVCLSSCFVSNSVIDDLEILAADAISERSFSDASNVRVPMSPKDLAELMQEVPSFKTPSSNDKKIVIMADSFFVSAAFLEDLESKCKSVIKETLEAAYAAGEEEPSLKSSSSSLLRSSLGASSDSITLSSSGSVGNKKSKQADSKKVAIPKVTSPSDQLREMKPVILKVFADSKTQGKEGQDKINDINPILSHLASAMFERLFAYKTEIDNELMKQKLEKEAALEPVAEARPEKVDSKAQSKRREAESSGGGKPLSDREKLKEFPKKFEIFSLNFQLFLQGIAQLKSDEAKTRLTQYLLSSLGQDLCNLIVEYLAALKKIPLEQSLKTLEDRAMVIVKLGKDIQASITQLEKSRSQKKGEPFLENLAKIAELCEVSVKPLNAKSARTLIFTHQREATDEMKATTNPLVTVPLLVSAVYMKVRGAAIYADSNALSFLLDDIKDDLSPTVLKTLRELIVLFDSFRESKEKSGDGDVSIVEKIKALLDSSSAVQFSDPKIDLKSHGV